MRKQLLINGAFVLIACANAFAQTAGEINGEITDPSGASVPNVPVTATNTGTNVSRSTTTNTEGLYSFPDLVPGTYQVKVVAQGFDTQIKTNIELQVQQVAKVDFSLVVGQATQTIEVSASVVSLETEGATVGTVIEQQRIEDLPLNGRSFFSLVELSPGVTIGFGAPAQASGREGGSRAALTMSLAGSRATWSNYTLDGIANTDVDFNLYILLPSIDALQEFKVQSGVYPAEFGREAGQVNVSTKPGTNTYHGTLFEFLRNDKLDARPYDFIGNHPAKAAFRQNQYGFTLSGPVQIPKIFNGKNRLFFMTNYEGFESRTTTVSIATTMPEAMIGGNFSVNPATGVGVATALQDPNTRALVNGQWQSSPFPGNIIPPSRLSTASLLLASKFFPLPNLTQSTTGLPLNNYQYNVPVPVDKNQVTERLDFTQSPKSQWFGRYSWTNESNSNFTPGITVDGNTLFTRASEWEVSNTRIISPTKVNEARFGYNSIYNVVTQQLANKENVDAEIGVPIAITDPNSWGVPNISLGDNLSSFGNPTASPFTINDKIYQGIDNFSWVIGKHALRFGGEYRNNQFPQIGNEFPRGQFFFGNGGLYTAIDTSTNPTTGSVSQTGGYNGADFLLGDVARADFAVALASANFSNNEWATYIDDTWKVLPHLTISMGLRWEVEQPLLDSSGKEVNTQLNQALPYTADDTNPATSPVLVRAGTGNFYDGLEFRYVGNTSACGSPIAYAGCTAPPVLTARDGRLGARLVNTDYHNFAPRLGIAWSPSDKWSIRAGFGIFFSQESKNSIFDLSRGLGGRATILPTVYAPPAITYDNFISAAALPVNVSAGLIWGVSPNLATTYSMTYVLNVQRTLGRGTTLEFGYNGIEDRKLALLTDQDFPAILGNAANILRFPYPQFTGIQYLSTDGVGNYNALTGKLSQRIGKNLTTLFSYTWSKALDDSSAIRGTGNEFAPQNAHCRSCDYGYSTFNIPQRFVASILYTLPFGKGQQFLNYGGVADRIVGGWQFSTITTIQDGMPVDTTSWDSGGTQFNPPSSRLNCVAGADPYLSNPTPNFFLNTTAFTNPLIGTLGTCARNDLRGPKQVNIDFSTIKDFHLTEKHTLQFRMEMFNAPNHVELGSPNASWGNSNPAPAAPATTFGQDHSTATTMRQIQFALKYKF